MGVALMHLLTLRQSKACVICVSGGPRAFEDIELLRQRMICVAIQRNLEPVLVEQRVVDYPFVCLTEVERSARNKVITGIVERHYGEIWIAGTILSEFARIAVIAARKSETNLRFETRHGTPLRRYASLFRKSDQLFQAQSA